MKTLKHIPAALALLAMAGCQNEEIQPLDFQTDPSAVHISASVGRMGTRSNPHDDALPGFNAGDRISVSTADQPAVVYTFDGNNTWTPEEGKYLTWLNTSDVNTGQNFTAYYPSTYTGDGNLPIETDQSILGNLQKSDIMSFYGSCTKGQNNTVSLTLQRLTSRIVISKDFDWQGQYLDGENPTHRVQSIQIHIKEGDITTTITPYKVENGHYYALVPPTYNSNASVFLTLTVVPNEGGGETQYTINGIYALIPGYSNTYTLTIGKDVAKVGNVTVAKWATGSIIEKDAEGKTDVMDVGFTFDKATKTYSVTNAEGLLAVNKLITENIATQNTYNITLLEDIVLDVPADGSPNWTAIGQYPNYYNGVFNGNGKSITGLVVKSETQACLGLIGELGSGGKVLDLELVSPTVTNLYTATIYDSAGGIAGANAGLISGCAISGTSSITCADDNAGGIAGLNDGGYIYGCTVGGTVSVDAAYMAGGIAGKTNAVSNAIVSCFVNGVKLNTKFFGGIAGSSAQANCIIGCYAYQCSYMDGDTQTALAEVVNIVPADNDGNDKATESYYTTWSDESTPATFGAVNGTATVTDWSGAMKAMNAAIDAANPTVKYHWSGTQDAPTLTKVTSDSAQE